MNFVCKACESENVQRLSVIYESGLSDINTKSRAAGIGFGRGGIGVGVGRSKTSGTSQTAASQRAAPPPKKKYLKPLLWIALASVILAITFGSKSNIDQNLVNITWLVASIGWVVYAIHYNMNKWPPLKTVWDNSFLCNRCNEIFSLIGN